VPAAGQAVRLRGNANLSTGGTAEDVTGRIHPDTAQACVRAAQKIGLDVAGIDLVCSDIAAPLGAQRGAMIEVNAAPGIRMHEHPSHGERHHVGRAIVASLFPHGSDGRIPVVAVTGTNGKTTTVLAIDHVMRSLGRSTGVTTTEGVFLDGRQVKTGDCTGYWSARTVLSSPTVDFAVLETARGGLLKRGLAFDRCDVAVVLNIGNDHLGQDGVDTVEDLARVKGLLVDSARVAVVLNAEDPLCAALRKRARRGVEVVYFSHDLAHPTFAEHVDRGGRGVYESGGLLMWADGGHQLRLASSQQLPFTLQGKARHNVSNAMAVLAALISLEIPPERVVAGLSSFTSSESQNPLRLNVYQTEGVTLLVDYAHNAAAYRAIAETGRALTSGRLIGVVAAPGDRRDDDLIEIGRACGGGFDAVVVYEMDDKRGRPAGATAGFVARGVAEAREARRGAQAQGGDEPVPIVLDVRAAIRAAVQRSGPGDFVVIGCASHLSDLKAALGADASLTSLDAGGLSPGADATAAGRADTAARPAQRAASAPS
jgi:cyanophycin synthetase